MSPAECGKCLQIRLDSRDVVFRSRHRDGKRQIVQGDVVLNTNAPTTIRSVKITLRGIRKVSWVTDTLQATTVQQKQTLFLQTQHLHLPDRSAAAKKTPPGSHTWPFLFALPATLPESVDWLPANTFIAYALTATASTGRFSRPLTATERLRLVKTPSFRAADLDFALPAARELLWPDALVAQVTLPQPLLPADGAALALDFRLLPLAAAPRFGAVTLELVQTLQLVVTRDGAPSRTTRKTRSVASAAASVERLVAAQRAKDGGAAEEDGDGDGGGVMCFSVELALPGPPFSCVQSVDDEGVKVRYTLRAGLEVEDAEGEMCERSVLFHPKLFAPVRSELAGPGSSGTDLDLALFEDCPEASGLPCYGEHLFDTLYCEERSGRISEDVRNGITAM